MSDFVHLHVHSHYSLLDGLAKIPELVKKAKSLGYKALALTDHGNMYGAIEFYQCCQQEGIKPIIGMEAYLAPASRFDKDKDDRYYHLILLALNYTGYKNLMKLSSLSNLEGFYYKPRMDKELLKQYHEGLVASSACFSGEIPWILRKEDNYEKAKKVALEYQEIFGEGNFYLEMMDVPAQEGQMELNTKLAELSKDTGIPLIITRDSHYLEPEDAEAQDILTCIRDGRTLDEENRMTMNNGADYSLASPKEVISRFKHTIEAIANTVKIADRVDLKLELNKWHFPAIEIPEGKTANEYLREQVYEKLPKLIEMTEDVKKRADYELDIISAKGYSPYFLSVADYVRYARENRIMFTTRGSAAGSIVSYALGIVMDNPLFFKLPFERFLNPFRPSPPDIDGDFADDRRDEMIAYVTKKYGADKVAQIITFGTMAARGSVRDVGRALCFPYSFCDQISKLIPFGAQGFQMTIAKALNLEPELKKLYDKNADAKRLLDLAQKVEGCARHTSIHAAGVVISPTPLTDFTPVQFETGGERIITQYEMHSVEAAGVLKMDFLGIRNLSILGHAVEIIQKTTGQKIDVYSLYPWNDKKTYEMLARGETVGVFQLSSSGMTRYLKELKPTTIFDIMAMVALFRPGPMDSIPDYILRKNRPELIEYEDIRMKDYLDQSLGLIVYQDDVLLTAINLAGYNWEEADKFRKAMGKKIPEEMMKQKEKFFKGCKEIGKVSEGKINVLWERIEPFAAYGFNKCLAGDTKIEDPNTGKIQTIAEIYKKKNNVKVLSLQVNKKLSVSKSIKVYSNGRKRVWELKTRSGRLIKTTSEHRFLTFAGWKRLKELKTGSLVATPRIIKHNASAKLSASKLKVLGYLLSEGNLCHPHGVYYYSTVSDEVKDFVKHVKKGFRNVKITIDDSKPALSVYVGQTNQKNGDELRNWLKELGLCDKKATEKIIPNIIFRLSKSDLGIFMGALWQGDGCIHVANDSQVYYATSSKILAGQLQHLLLRLGIIGTLHTKSFKYRGGVRPGYTVNVSRYTNWKLFDRYVAPHLIGHKQHIWKQLMSNNQIINGSISERAARGSKDIVPVEILDVIKLELKKNNVKLGSLKKLGIAPRLLFKDKKKKGYLRETIEALGKISGSKLLLDYGQSDIYWDEIVSIKPKGTEDTYDLEITGDHNFVANDFVVHNSHAASYGVVAYQTAYLKSNYPVQYISAVLIAESGDIDKVPAIIHECGRMGIEVKPPDVNESFKNFAMVGWENGQEAHIRFGLSGVKNVGEHIADVIYHERKERGKYKNLEEFLSRVQDKDLNKKSLESLIKCGAL